MISKMKADGSRIGIVFNGSPLFTGQAGSGESEIRKWIIENDWLEAIVASPDRLFYNTGIPTYIWIDHSKTKTGYEINFTKYFYEFKPLRSLAEIKADIQETVEVELERAVLNG